MEDSTYLTTVKGLHCWYGHMVRSVGALAAQLPTDPSFKDHVAHLRNKVMHIHAALKQKSDDTKDYDRREDLLIMAKKVKQMSVSIEVLAKAATAQSRRSSGVKNA